MQLVAVPMPHREREELRRLGMPLFLAVPRYHPLHIARAHGPDLRAARRARPHVPAAHQAAEVASALPAHDGHLATDADPPARPQAPPRRPARRCVPPQPVTERVHLRPVLPRLLRGRPRAPSPGRGGREKRRLPPRGGATKIHPRKGRLEDPGLLGGVTILAIFPRPLRGETTRGALPPAVSLGASRLLRAPGWGLRPPRAPPPHPRPAPP